MITKDCLKVGMTVIFKFADKYQETLMVTNVIDDPATGGVYIPSKDDPKNIFYHNSCLYYPDNELDVNFEL